MGEVASSTLLRKGAEASLFLTEWHGRRAAIKSRLPKKYRHKRLDSDLRRFRTVREAQLIHEAKCAGVLTPMIFMVDVKNAVIIMEHVEGQQVKTFLETKASSESLNQVCEMIGDSIGRLHQHGVIHGDLTTSNMILNPEERIVFIDFGLGDKTSEYEARGVDLHLMKHALQSTHFQIADSCFTAVMDGYAKIMGKETTEKVLDKIREIERRGRYIADRKQDA